MRRISKGVLLMMILSMVLSACGNNNNKVETKPSPKVTASASATADAKASPKTERDPVNFRIHSLKGPTTMGITKLMSDSEAGNTTDKYDVTIHGTADEIAAGIIKGDVDVALIPCNLASVLYQKTKHNVKVAAINTLGVLYVVETGDSIKSVSDLKGKTIYATGKGTTPEYALNYVLTENGIDPSKDVTIEYKSESTEVVAMLKNSDNAIAILPEPYVTTASVKNDKIHTVINLSEEWNKVAKDGSSMVTAVTVVRKDFLDANKDAFNEFMEKYKESADWVNANVSDAAALCEKYNIVSAAVATKAIPKCNITCITGDEMKSKLSGFLSVLNDANPKSIGGTLPDDNFYLELK